MVISWRERNKKTPVHLGEHELPFFLALILESAAWAWPVGLELGPNAEDRKRLERTRSQKLNAGDRKTREAASYQAPGFPRIYMCCNCVESVCII